MISVVIPSRNTRALTLDCIASLQGPGKPEIIVVDNASTDDTAEAIREQFPDVRLIENDRNLGFAVACNKGAAAARGDFLFFLNSDALGSIEALDRLAEAFRAEPCLAIVAPRNVGPDGCRQETVGCLCTPSTELGRSAKRQAQAAVSRAAESDGVFVSGAYFCGAAVMVRREAFEEIGGFDETFFFYYEDQDLSKRVLERGWSMGLARDVSITHVGGASSKAIPLGASIEMLRSRLRFIAKHYGTGWRLLVGVNHFLGRLRRSALNLVAVVLTLGVVPKFRCRLAANAGVVLWFLLGMPGRERRVYRALFCDWER